MKLIDILVEELPNRGGWPSLAKKIHQDYDGEVWSWIDEDEPLLIFTLDQIATNARQLGKGETYENMVTREQYEAALAAKNEGWIEWGGGRCPVDDVTEVDIKFLTGGIAYGVEAGKYYWPRTGREYDIIAYRLHKIQEAEHDKADDEVDLNECIGQDAAPVWSGEGQPPVGVECEVSVDGGRSWCTYRAINEKNGARLIEIGNFTEEFQNNNWIFRPISSEADRKRDEAVQALCNAGGGSGRVDEKSGYGSCWFDIYDAIAAGKIPGVKLDN